MTAQFVAVEWGERAVIDRAYSKKVCVCVLLCKAPFVVPSVAEVPDPEKKASLNDAF